MAHTKEAPIDLYRTMQPVLADEIFELGKFKVTAQEEGEIPYNFHRDQLQEVLVSECRRFIFAKNTHKDLAYQLGGSYSHFYWLIRGGVAYRHTGLFGKQQLFVTKLQHVHDIRKLGHLDSVLKVVRSSLLELPNLLAAHPA